MTTTRTILYMAAPLRPTDEVVDLTWLGEEPPGEPCTLGLYHRIPPILGALHDERVRHEAARDEIVPREGDGHDAELGGEAGDGS